jgi:hypothetical protein
MERNLPPKLQEAFDFLLKEHSFVITDQTP